MSFPNPPWWVTFSYPYSLSLSLFLSATSVQVFLTTFSNYHFYVINLAIEAERTGTILETKHTFCGDILRCTFLSSGSIICYFASTAPSATCHQEDNVDYLSLSRP